MKPRGKRIGNADFERPRKDAAKQPLGCASIRSRSAPPTPKSIAEERVKVVRLRKNFGQSAALQAGFDHAAGDVIATMDGDLQNDPADLPAMIAKLDDGYDVILGERAGRQDKFLLRKVPSWCANWLIRKTLNVPFRDFGCTLRVMRREVVERLQLTQPHFAVNAETGLQPLLMGYSLREVPISWINRTPDMGSSSFHLGKVGRGYMAVLFRLWWKHLAGAIAVPPKMKSSNSESSAR